MAFRLNGTRSGSAEDFFFWRETEKVEGRTFLSLGEAWEVDWPVNGFDLIQAVARRQGRVPIGGCRMNRNHFRVTDQT